MSVNAKFISVHFLNVVNLFSALTGAVDVNVRNDRGWTALMLAARNGHKDVITELLEKG